MSLKYEHSSEQVRPAFMDEYEKLEDELQDLFRVRPHPFSTSITMPKVDSSVPAS